MAFRGPPDGPDEDDNENADDGVPPLFWHQGGGDGPQNDFLEMDEDFPLFNPDDAEEDDNNHLEWVIEIPREAIEGIHIFNDIEEDDELQQFLENPAQEDDNMLMDHLEDIENGHIMMRFRLNPREAGDSIPVFLPDTEEETEDDSTLFVDDGEDVFNVQIVLPEVSEEASVVSSGEGESPVNNSSESEEELEESPDEQQQQDEESLAPEPASRCFPIKRKSEESCDSPGSKRWKMSFDGHPEDGTLSTSSLNSEEGQSSPCSKSVLSSIITSGQEEDCEDPVPSTSGLSFSTKRKRDEKFKTCGLKRRRFSLDESHEDATVSTSSLSSIWTGSQDEDFGDLASLGSNSSTPPLSTSDSDSD